MIPATVLVYASAYVLPGHFKSGSILPGGIAMRKIIIAVALLGFTLCSTNVLAQRGSDNCEMYVVDGDAKKDVMLETFTTIIGEEELTNKTYPLLKTGLFI